MNNFLKIKAKNILLDKMTLNMNLRRTTKDDVLPLKICLVNSYWIAKFNINSISLKTSFE